MAGLSKAPLAAPATTGNNSHASIGVISRPALIAVEFVIEAIGATPTVTYKLQGTFDPVTTVDGSANWFDVILLPSDNDTAAITAVKTTVGTFVSFLAQSHVRFVPRVRLVTSSNTNVTYHANLLPRLR